MVIPMTRGSTSKEILGVDWDYPVPPADSRADQEGGRTYASTSKVLSRSEALAFLTREDQRPLLIFRECINCLGTESAVFSRRFDNEKIKLLLNWFHCVKLPPEVTKEGHPFRSLFAVGGKHWFPHLFICSADGSNQFSFDGKQPQSLMQRELVALVELSYAKRPQPAIKSMLRSLSEFDMLDLRARELKAALLVEAVAHGDASSKHKKLASRLQETRDKMAKAMARAKAVCDLKLQVAAGRPL
jgi:hypothetical protein